VRRESRDIILPENGHFVAETPLIRDYDLRSGCFVEMMAEGWLRRLVAAGVMP
jgi:hypothetical protein